MMDETTFRILDILSKEIGNPLSINELTKKIEERYGTAYYVNIYDKIRSLAGGNIITLSRTGKSSIANLNFESYLLVDLLTEMELKRKLNFLEKRQEFQMLFKDLETRCRDLNFLRSICIINPEKNAKLNRAELLIIIRSPAGDAVPPETETTAIRKIMQLLQSIHNLKIDHLVLTDVMLLNLLATPEINPIREMLANKIAFFSPQTFWMTIKIGQERDIPVRILEKETNPAKMPEQDLVYNLARFGYKEMGTEILQRREISIEYIVTSILLQGDARRKDAIPIILAKKGSETNYDLLVFLCQKYGVLGELFGLLKALDQIKPMAEIKEAIRNLKSLKIEAIRVDAKNLQEKMRLYNVT